MAGLGTINTVVGGLGDVGRATATVAGWVPPTTSAELGSSRTGAGVVLCELEPPARLVLVGGGESVEGPKDVRGREQGLCSCTCAAILGLLRVFLQALPDDETAFCSSSNCFARGSTVADPLPMGLTGDDALERGIWDAVTAPVKY